MKSRVLFLLMLGSMAAVIQGQSADDALKWFALNQKAIATARHLVVNVQLRFGENEYVRYRLDRTPELLRIQMEDGNTFVFAPGRQWLRSRDWGYSGTLVTDAQAMDLNGNAANVDVPLRQSVSKDSSQGAQVWKYVGETTAGAETLTAFELSREHPRPDGVYPTYTYAREKQGALATLRHFSAQFRGPDGKMIPVEMEYQVLTSEDSAAVRRRDLTAEVQFIKSQMAMQPIKLEGQFISEKTLKIKGLVDGENSDLVFTREDGSRRHIVVLDGLCWTSDDDGKSWQTQKEPDRGYARLLSSPMLYNGRDNLGPSGITLQETARKETADGIEQQLGLSLPPGQKPDTEPFQMSIARSVGGEPVIHSYHGPVWMMGRANKVEAEYAYASGTTVQLPAGVPLRLPKLVGDKKPEALLYEAKRDMSRQPRCHVSVKIDDDEVDSGIEGILEGQRSDLTITAKNGAVIRQITTEDGQFISRDDGKTWTRQKMDEDWHNIASGPKNFIEGEKIPSFEIIDQHWPEKGGVLAHIRLRAPQAVSDDSDRPNVWLEIHPDASIWMKRYQGPWGYHGRYIQATVEYEMPSQDTKPVQAPRVDSAK